MTDQALPKVFISYSHDSREHKQWVAELATALTNKGIHCILDQWDLRLGEDAAKFMERGLQDSDRVLVVCTSQYVRKADAGEGGVGYESMIVTAQVIQNLGTDKFIPVIREGTGNRLTPTCLSTRLYANLRSEVDDYEEELEKVVREIHRQPPAERPEPGTNPFAGIRPASEPTSTDAQAACDPAAAYTQAVALARHDDVLGWRQLFKDLRPAVYSELSQWVDEFQGSREAKDQRRSQVLDQILHCVAPLMAVALAGTESENGKFLDQRGLIDELRELPGCDVLHGGPLPDTLGFMYQGLYGAVCAATSQWDLVEELAYTPITTDEEAPIALWKHHQLIGWPPWFQSCKGAWNFLIDRAEKWPWLTRVFGDSRGYRIGMYSYYLVLSMIELSEYLSREGKAGLESSKTMHLDVPVCFAIEKREISRGAMQLIGRAQAQISPWKTYGVPEALFRESWPLWIAHMQRWLSEVFGGFPTRDMSIRDLYR